MNFLVSIYAFVIGACFGSFALASAWRIKKKKRLLSSSRSQCESCKHQLHAQDLVPLVSWALLKGKCRYCHKKLSPLFPAAEVLGGALFAASYIFWPDGLRDALGVIQYLLWFVSLVPLLILFLYDVQWFELPNKVIYPLWALSGASFLVGVLQEPTLHTLFYGASAVAIAAGFFYLIFEVSKGTWIGFGDVRLGVAIGLLLANPLLAGLSLFAASTIGIVVALPGLITRSRSMSSKLPFGPLLILGLVLVRLFGQRVIDWYTVSILML